MSHYVNMISPFVIAKTEKKAEMEVPLATKVKVTDLFQRLVCGLLILLRNTIYVLSSVYITCMLLQICTVFRHDKKTNTQ